MITIKIADITIGLDNRYEYTERYVKEFICDGAPEFTVSASEEEIEHEFEISGVRIPHEYAENVVLYRKIAERLPDYDAIVFHGAVIETEDAAYAVTAHSGVGKTTHLRLWLSHFGDSVKILNGDKPIIRFIDGRVYACSTPWMGKEDYGYNAMKPLCGIGFIARGEENKARRISSDAAVVRLMNQIYLAKGDVRILSRSMRLADRILSSVPLYEFECNMTHEAAQMTYEAFVRGITND